MLVVNGSCQPRTPMRIETPLYGRFHEAISVCMRQNIRRNVIIVIAKIGNIYMNLHLNNCMLVYKSQVDAI